jgi:ABC-type uncharacterized transport system substrate-binding protein
MTHIPLRLPGLRTWLLALAATAAALTALPREAPAHPHAWIDVKVKVLFDEKGRIYALEETWLFDPLYTAFSLEGVKRDKDGRPDQRAIDALMAENMKNIKEYNYLTEVESQGVKAAFSGVRDVYGTHENKRLRLAFTLLLDKPVAADKAPVQYAVFDPTYYIEMLHAEGGGAIELSGGGNDCRYRMIPPNPSPDAVGLAAALDRTQSGGDGLGKLFAERVSIRCGAAP